MLLAAMLVVAVVVTCTLANVPAGGASPLLAIALLLPSGGLFGMAIPLAVHRLPVRPTLPRVAGYVVLLLAATYLVLALAREFGSAVTFWGGLGCVALGLVSQATLGQQRRNGTGSGAPAPATDALWVPPGHFYSPIPDLTEVRADAGRVFAAGLRDLPGIDLAVPAQLALLRELARCYGTEDFAAAPEGQRRYGTANDFFCYGDAFVWHALLRHLQPARVVEVGSGWSSAVLLDTNDRHCGGRIECTFIEPFPERLQQRLLPGDTARVRLLAQRVQDVPLTVFTALAAGDVLFVDSSHVCKTGSDVHHILFEILPRLARGVWVHCHDIFANFEYPQRWVDEGRAWNENYFLRAFLLDNHAWRIELHPATLAASRDPDVRAQLAAMPKLAANIGGSLWLRRR